MRLKESDAAMTDQHFREPRALRVLRWLMRAVSVVLVIVLFIVSMGEDMPQIAATSGHAEVLFAGLVAIFAGLLLALAWEGPGAVLILLGFFFFAFANRGIPVNVVFMSVLITGVTFLFIWWRSRLQRQSGEDTDHDR